MKKRIPIFKLLAVILFVLTVIPLSAESITINDINYEINDGEATCTGTNKTEGEIEILDYVEYEGVSYPVTAIGPWAFYGKSNLTGSLTIPNTVKSIGNYAFLACSGFDGILTIGHSVNYIGYSAFENCRSFTGSLTIPDSVTTIGEWAFGYCRSFTGSLTIPDSVTTIGSRSFYGCSGFDGSLSIGDSVTVIGLETFEGCGFKGTLTIGKSVTIIHDSAFSGCSGFTGSLNIPEAVTIIGSSAFFDCSGFTGSLTLTNSVTIIDTCAFYGCSGFSGSLNIPNSLTTIGVAVFEGCSGFTGSLTIPNSVTTIGYHAFCNCSGFTDSLVIPNSVASIGEEAFSGCVGFDGPLVLLGDNAKSIADNAFDGSNMSATILQCPPDKKKYNFYPSPAYVYTEYIDEFKKIWDDRSFLPLGIILDGDLSPMKINEVRKYTASISAPDPYNRGEIEWSSSDDSVISVDAEGLLVALKPGVAQITAKITNSILDFKEVSVTLSVLDSYKCDIDLNHNEAWLNPDQELSLELSPDCPFVGERSWISSDEAVATVDDNGNVTAVAPGYTIIRVSIDGEHFGECTIYVASIRIVSDNDDNELSVLKKGESIQLSTNVQAGNIPNLSITWSSSDTNVAMVDENGLVWTDYYFSAGKTIIKASLNGQLTAEWIVMVPDIAIRPNDYIVGSLKSGDTIQFEAYIYPEDLPDQSIIWDSSNTDVASIDENGLLTANNAGITKITATLPYGVSNYYYIQVSGIDITIDKDIYNVGDKNQFTVDFSSDFDNYELIWESTDPETVSVDQDGNIEALAYGSATIYATIVNGATASKTVYVPYLYIEDKQNILNIGETTEISVKVFPEEVADRKLIRVSSDTDIVSVSENGELTTVGFGEAEVSVYFDENPDVKTSCRVNTIYVYDGISYIYDKETDSAVIYDIDDRECGIILENITLPYGNGSRDYEISSIRQGIETPSLRKIAIPEKFPFNFGSEVLTIKYPEGSTIRDGIVLDQENHKLLYLDLYREGVYEIADDVKEIGKYALAYCNLLTELTIPEGVVNIENDALYECTGISQVLLADGRNDLVVNNAFANCTFDYLYMGRTIAGSVSWPTSIKSVETGRYVDKLENNIFSYLPNLYSLTIGVGMREISVNAFAGSKISKAIWLPNTPPTGYSNVLADINYVSTTNYELENMKVSANLSSKFMQDGLVYVFNRKAVDRTVAVIDTRYNRYITDLNVPHKLIYQGIEFTVEEISDYGLYQNEYYTTAYIGDGVSSVGKYALYNCVNIAEAPYLGKSIYWIDDFAFCGCKLIPSIIIPDATEYLGAYSLALCGSLESAILGKSLRVIEEGCFKGDSELKQIVIPINVNTIANKAFDNCTSLEYLEISDRNDVTLLLGYGSANKPLFADCPIKTVYIGGDISYSTLPANGYSPFYRNDAIEKVIIYNNETEISDNEFYGCRNLKEVILGDDVKTVGKYAFSGCLSLEYFTLGSQVQAIGTDAFSDCDKMKELISYNIIPPVCDDQAMDDINKFTCTLYVPFSAINAYKAADQWENFYHIDGIQIVDIPVEEIRLSPDSWMGSVGSTFTINALVLPVTATDKFINWSSDNISVATVDNGLVQIVGAGECIITARANDGSNVVAQCEITAFSYGNTGIDDAVTDGSAPLIVYNMQGVRLDITTVEELNRLLPGIYIVNGQKVRIN